jgi:hypothetical protein
MQPTQHAVTFTAKTAGQVNAIAFWFQLHLTPEEAEAASAAGKHGKLKLHTHSAASFVHIPRWRSDMPCRRPALPAHGAGHLTVGPQAEANHLAGR